MSKRILIENYFRNKYPDERYQFKAYHTIEDMFGVKGTIFMSLNLSTVR